MKVAVIAALATASMVAATPIDVMEHAKRQGTGFPATCNSVCSGFFPTYNSCVAITTQPAFNNCLQPICAPSLWSQLSPCLNCWSTATGQSTLPWWMLFQSACV